MLVYVLTIVVYQNITTELLAFHHRLIKKKRKEEYIFKSFWFYLNSLNFVNFQILNYIFQSDCYNFIKILLVHKDEILVCGTNAFDPRCTWRAVSITVTTTISVFIQWRWCSQNEILHLPLLTSICLTFYVRGAAFATLEVFQKIHIKWLLLLYIVSRFVMAGVKDYRGSRNRE